MLNKFKFRVHVSKDALTHGLARTNSGTHALYFGAAFLEWHTVYAVIAGLLVIFTIASWFVHFE